MKYRKVLKVFENKPLGPSVIPTPNTVFSLVGTDLPGKSNPSGN